jgi:F-type H+-transporting ATPase subunit b
MLPPNAIKFAEESLKLTPTDLIFIPVGSFLFFVFWKLMENAVFDPFLALHEAREAATEGSQELAQQKLAEAARLENEAEEQLNLARREAVQLKLAQVAEAKKQASLVITEAENQAMEFSEKAIQEAADKITKLKLDLESKAGLLAGDVVEKLKSAPQIANGK